MRQQRMPGYRMQQHMHIVVNDRRQCIERSTLEIAQCACDFAFALQSMLDQFFYFDIGLKNNMAMRGRECIDRIIQQK